MIDKFIANLVGSNRLVAGSIFFFNAPGHVLPETDYLMRQIRLRPEIASRRPVVFLHPTPLSAFVAELLKKLSISIVLDENAFHLAREIQLFYPQMVVETGIAHFRVAMPPEQRRKIATSSPAHLAWALSCEGLNQQWCDIFKAWRGTEGYFPLREALDQIPGDPKFIAQLRRRKYVVLQRKSQIVNGTVRILDDAFFEPTLAFLKDSGYEIFLAGREPMLDAYKKYGVFNYPGSTFVSPKNDFYLFRNADFGIISPSGAGYFCDTLGIPHCQYAPWTLQPNPSPRTIMVPTRLRDRTTGNLLTYSQQVLAFMQNYNEVIGPAYYNPEKFEDLPPTGDDLLHGVQELLATKTCSTDAERADAETVRTLDASGMWKCTQSRMASSFLNQHRDYLA